MIAVNTPGILQQSTLRKLRAGQFKTEVGPETAQAVVQADLEQELERNREQSLRANQLKAEQKRIDAERERTFLIASEQRKARKAEKQNFFESLLSSIFGRFKFW